MGLFLQIVGGVVLAIVLLVIIGLWFLKRQLKKLGRALMEMSGADTATPTTIELVEVVNQDGSSNPKVAALAEEFSRLGFARGAACTVKEIPGLWVYPFANSGQSIYTVVYDHKQVGVWFDIVARYTDETSHTYSNSPMGHQLDHRPGHDKTYDQSGTPSAMLSSCLSGHRGRQLKPANASTFKHDFETAYREEMEWRNSRGGPTEEEIRRVAAGEYDDDTITAAHALLSQRASESLDETLMQRFLEQATYSASEWEEMRDRIVIVHEKKSLEDLEEEVCDWADCECEPIDGESPRVYMQRLNSTLRPGGQFEKVGELNDPVRADVYVAPN